ncbi:MAG: SDR family oxidoreductase [Defluviitaleaceae bacterium]|nr:SDR family oxidoreductase [Defluviitaleaceae bacterium]
MHTTHKACTRWPVNNQVIITGGANGIGRCIAEAFLHINATVVIIDIDKLAGESMQARHKNLRFFHGDIAEKETLEQLVNSLSQPINCLINIACIGRHGLLSGCSYHDFEYVQRVGVTAPFYLTSLLLQKDLLAHGASIVNISSTRANQSQPDTESYTAAKGGILALTHAMAVSLAGKARVNAISPGWIETATYHTNAKTHAHSPQDNAQHPAGRIGTPEDIAEAVLFLCSTKAGFITGETITIDGGMSRLMIYNNDHGWRYELT